MIGNEFAHLHPPQDGSLRMMLPECAVPRIVDLGRGHARWRRRG